FGPALGDFHHRPGHLEVVIILRVDRADLGGIPGQAQLIDHPAGGLTCIVPAFEGSDDCWRGESSIAVQLDHPPPPSGPPLTRMTPGYVHLDDRRVTRGPLPLVPAARPRGARRPRIGGL